MDDRHLNVNRNAPTALGCLEGAGKLRFLVKNRAGIVKVARYIAGAKDAAGSQRKNQA